MKIYFVTPKNPASFWTMDSLLPILGKAAIVPNISLPTLAALTPDGYEVVLCDENAQAVDMESNADVVGLTGYGIHAGRIRQLADHFRARGCLVVVGGPFASLCPDEVASFADVVFVGEAEHTWPRFLEDLRSGHPASRYEERSKPAPETWVAPQIQAIDVGRYSCMAIQCSRGCPFNCEFCDIIVTYGREVRRRDIDCVLAEVQRYRDAGATRIFFVDDNFIGNPRYARRLLAKLGEWGRARGHPIAFNAQVSLNVANDESLLTLLRDANFASVFIGIESPREVSLLEAKKPQNTRHDLVGQVQRVQRHGIEVQAGMIVGFDHDDPEIFDEQLDFLQQAGIPIAMVGMLQAVPTTPLFDRLARAGRLVPGEIGDQFVFSNIVPASMSRRELYLGYAKLVERLYEPAAFADRVLRFLAIRGPTPSGATRARHLVASVGWREVVRVLARVVMNLGVRDPARAHFTFGLCFRAMRLSPRAVPEALAFAVWHKALADYVDELVVQLRSASEENHHPLAAVDPGVGTPVAAPGTRGAAEPHMRSSPARVHR